MQALARSDSSAVLPTPKAVPLRLARNGPLASDAPTVGAPDDDRSRSHVKSPAKGTVLEYASAADLRRKRSREITTELLERSHWLAPEDRALMLAVLRDNLTAAEVALARAERPRIVRRRISQLIKHMSSPLFNFAVNNAPRWPEVRRAIATSVVLRSRSNREAAAELGLSLHTVRSEMHVIQALAET